MRDWRGLLAAPVLCAALFAALFAAAPATAKDEPAAGLAEAPQPGLIVGGRPARAGAWPWQVALYYQDRFTCGGSVVAARWVLTAAHCVDGRNPALFTVQVGTHFLDNIVGGGRTLNVAAIYAHPDYDDETVDNDMALLLLDRPAKVRAIRPITPRQEARFARPGTRAVVTGWGATSEKGPISEQLQQVGVPIRRQGLCRRSFDPGEITDNMFCAGFDRGGRDACQGDSGGPLVVRNANGRWLLAGVVSWGVGCARPGRPGIYARVSRYGDWITETLSRDAAGQCYEGGLPPVIRRPRDFECLPLAATDDFSAGPVPLGFSAQLGFGLYDRIFVNANGSLSFSDRFAGFRPRDLERFTQLFAPFLADVDTRAGGTIHYGRATVRGRPAFIALYQNVGYFEQGSDKRNSFQVVLIQRGPAGSGDYDVEFNYARIQWDSGAASGGVDGLGGRGAWVGWQDGNGNRFAWPGSARPGRFLDSNRRKRLIEASNVGTPGRLLFRVRGGVVQPPANS